MLSILFIPLSLYWSIPNFLILLLLTFSAIITLTLVYNSSQNYYYFNGDLLAVFSANYISLVDKTISDSVFNDSFLCINILIGLSMIIIGLLNKRKTMSIKDKFLLIVKNKKELFIIGLTMFLAISIINMLLFILGFGIIVDTSSLTLFLYTFFPKVINIRFILIFIICSITKEFKLDNLSLSLYSVIFMMLLGSVNYYYVMPYFKIIMFLGLTKLDNIFTRIYLLDYSAIKANSTQSLVEGIYNLITKFPIIGRLFSIRSNGYNYNLSSPFRSFYSEVIQKKVNIYPLTKISKFTRIDIARIVEKKVEFFYSYKGDMNSLEVQWNNNRFYLRDLISNLVSNYSNFTCKINLTCSDQILTIDTTFKNAHMEEFNLKTTNVNFANKVNKNVHSNLNFFNSLLNTQFSKNLFNLYPKNIDSFYDPSVDTTKQLLHLTDPMNNYSSDLQVFMQKGFHNYDYNIQHGESSRQSSHPSNSNRGIKRRLEDEDLDSSGNTNTSLKYPCLDIRMIELQNKNYLFLDFDPEKLDSERDSYLDEICLIGRSVLFEHYSKLIEDKSTVRTIVDGVGLADLSISDSIEEGYVKLYDAFCQKNIDIIKSHGVDPKNIHLFSKLYLEGHLDYPEDNYSEDGSSDDADNLDNYDLYHSDHSDNFVSLGDSTQTGQEVLKDLEPEDIKELISRLRSKQQEFLSKRGGANRTIKCSLKDIGLTHSKGAYFFKQGENPEDEITNMFNKLIKVKPDLFSNLADGQLVKTSLNTVCSRLNNLTQNSMNDLTEPDIRFLTRELKSRIHNYFKDRGFNIDSTKTCEFREIHIKNIAGVVVEVVGSNFVENEFTKLLGICVKKKPEYFSKRGTDVNLPKTSVSSLYNKLSNLIRKPITKNQVAYIVNALEIRKTNLLEHRKYTGNPSEFCNLGDLLFIRNSVILDKNAVLAEHQFTSFLENLRRERPNFVPTNVDIDLLLTDLRRLFHHVR
jgi:hypothetical protein